MRALTRYGDVNCVLARDLFIQMCLHCQRTRTYGTVSRHAVPVLAYPHDPAGAVQLADILVNVDLCARIGDDYQVISDLTLFKWGLPAARRERIPDALRTLVYERDGYRCVLCGTDESLSLDHIWPWSRGGRDTPDNLRTLCIPCNSRKGATV